MPVGYGKVSGMHSTTQLENGNGTGRAIATDRAGFQRAFIGRFQDLVAIHERVSTVLLGNAAFALGLIHAGFRSVEGYPGTPSTEVIDTLLSVPDQIDAGWSVNEAVAVGVGLGHSLAGDDTAVTMKVPGLFQAADVVSSSAFYDTGPGAFIIYVATDDEPSSTQNIIDARYFLSSCGIPILAPRDHQELYEIPRVASLMSRDYRLPVIILTSGILAHSEGLVTLGRRAPSSRRTATALRKSVLLPTMARTKYDRMVSDTLPIVAERMGELGATVKRGREEWGIISVGASTMAVREALAVSESEPPLMTLSGVFPFPAKTVEAFASRCPRTIVVFEEGGRFVEEQLKLLGIEAVGKQTQPTTTVWTPARILDLLASQDLLQYHAPATSTLTLTPVSRPPSICPGCPYRGIALIISKLKKKGRLDVVFGDIGCSTLVMFLGALDLNLCMGASESLRQGYVRSLPDSAGRCISLIGDSCECHSGLDATRNAKFRAAAGVKVILDNRMVAMTGGQSTPTTDDSFRFLTALKGEGIDTVEIDAFDLEGLEKSLLSALDAAKKGTFNALVVRGACLQSISALKKGPTLRIDAQRCTKCGRCTVCPGIAVDGDGVLRFTLLCRNCGGRENVCRQLCKSGAIVTRNATTKQSSPELCSTVTIDETTDTVPPNIRLPESIRISVRGIGGQGNLFLGRVLANVFLSELRPGMSIVKGETHGMAQLGGPVVSTFAFGNVHSPVFQAGTVDVLIGMEISEVLRDGFLALLKPGGTVILNNFSAPPHGYPREDYPSRSDIVNMMDGVNLIEVDAFDLARRAGDSAGMTGNVAVVGVLSTIEPFSIIPKHSWLKALETISKRPSQSQQNRRTFETAVRHFSGKIPY